MAVSHAPANCHFSIGCRSILAVQGAIATNYKTDETQHLSDSNTVPCLYTLENTRNCWIKLENVCESFSFRFFFFFYRDTDNDTLCTGCCMLPRSIHKRPPALLTVRAKWRKRIITVIICGHRVSWCSSGPWPCLQLKMAPAGGQDCSSRCSGGDGSVRGDPPA